MKFNFAILICFLFCACASASNWTFTRKLSNPPRGGTTTGIAVEYDRSTPESWIRLKEEGISDYERDRRAIYALEGEFEVKFEFIETILLETNKDWDVPYASKGTEFVKVIEDRGDFISLQHIMVLFMKDPQSGETIGPMLVKHWRQDWQWNPSNRMEFQGEKSWKVKDIKRRNGRGKWRWDVFQVDDSPRYSGLGTWNHMKSASTFMTDYMSRPLPRREFSVRSDYKVLLGTDTLVVTPNSWFHEQRNFKHQNNLSENGSFKNSKLLAREIGHNSYVRIKNFDFSSGYAYWDKSKGYWKDVREVWSEIIEDESLFSLRKKVDGKPLYIYHFGQAEDPDVLKLTSEKRKVLIRDTLNKFFIK
jgi:hypothetical protein